MRHGTTLNQILLSIAMTIVLPKVKQSWCHMFYVDHGVLDCITSPNIVLCDKGQVKNDKSFRTMVST